MAIIEISYTTGVQTPAGWRSETVTARAEKISEKRARIVKVIDVGGHGTAGYASRTGASRQRYSVGWVATREQGKIKILGACTIHP